MEIFRAMYFHIACMRIDKHYIVLKPVSTSLQNFLILLLKECVTRFQKMLSDTQKAAFMKALNNWLPSLSIYGSFYFKFISRFNPSVICHFIKWAHCKIILE